MAALGALDVDCGDGTGGRASPPGDGRRGAAQALCGWEAVGRRPLARAGGSSLAWRSARLSREMDRGRRGAEWLRPRPPRRAHLLHPLRTWGFGEPETCPGREGTLRLRPAAPPLPGHLRWAPDVGLGRGLVAAVRPPGPLRTCARGGGP